jgi:hypothetical protein
LLNDSREISENLHRAELTAQERADRIVEWVRITGEKESRAQPAPSEKSHTGGRPDRGINAAVRELGIDRTEARRSVKIAARAVIAESAMNPWGRFAYVQDRKV